MHQVASEITPVSSVTTTRTIPADDASVFTLSSNPAPLLTFHTPHITQHYLITLHALDGSPLAKVHTDGRVELSYPGAEEPAAKAFWNALQSYGTSIVARLRELEARLAKYEPVDPFVL